MTKKNVDEDKMETQNEEMKEIEDEETEEFVSEDIDQQVDEQEDVLEPLSEIDQLRLQLQELKNEVQAEKDKALRAFAELENFKKRKVLEMETFRKFANETIVMELLPVLDSFDRACEHTAEDSDNKATLLDGFQLIQKQFHNVLEKLGVTAIESVGKAFNTDFHQAVMQEENEEVDPNLVIREMQKGYTLNNRVIRPAMVVVSK
jgi:molecular chaperone GrpE